MLSRFSQLKQQIIDSHSCIDFLRFDCGIHNIYRENQCINTPDFIRHDDHPSFAVYHDHCFDFATQTFYNYLDLYCLFHFGSNDFNNLRNAVEAISGHSLNSEHSDNPSIYIQQQQAFNDFIAQAHKALLDNPIINPDGQDIHALDYFASRRISLDTVKTLKIGYIPSGSDYMHDRLLFPYFSMSDNGRPCSPNYANGRAAKPSKPGFPKYKKFALDDSRFSAILHNSVWGKHSQFPGKVVKDTFYNHDTQTTQTLETHHVKYDYLIISEGVFDTLAFWQEGYQVASGLGCGFSQEQKSELLQMCKHYADRNQKIFICLDNDKAGDKGQYSLALFLFKNKIPFVVGHLPQSFTVCLEGSPHFGENIPIKDVSDYYSAGGNLETLILNAKSGVAYLAEHCRNDRELGQLFEDTAKFADKLDLLHLKQAACSVMDDNGEVEYLDKKTGEITTVPDRKPRFSRSTVNALFAIASQSLMDNVIADLTAKQRRLLYDTAGQFYEYAGGCWRPVHDLIIQKYVADTMKGKLSAGKIGQVCKYLKIVLSQAALQFNTKPIWVFRNGTLWLDQEGEKIETRYFDEKVTDENGNFVPDPSGKYGHLRRTREEVVRTMIPNPDNPSQPKNFKPSKPEDMSTIQMNYDYRYGVRNLTWERYVAEWLGPDQDKIDLFQQMYGYVLFAVNKLQKFFYLIGDGANGKSTALHVLENVFGKDNCSSLQFHRFGSEFDTMTLKNSRVNICYDAKTELRGAEEMLKAVSSGDAIMAAHKGVDAETFTSNAKIFVAANKYFSATDISRGLLRRILFLCFDKTFDGNGQKVDIEDEIRNDPGGFAGVFNWAYEGYKKLKRDGKFVETEEQKRLVEEFKTQLSPLMVFAREEMYCRFGETINEKELFSAYTDWCSENYEKPLSRTKFTQEIRQVLRTDGSAIKAEKNDKGLWFFVFPDRPAGDPQRDHGDAEHHEDAEPLQSSETLQEEIRQVETQAQAKTQAKKPAKKLPPEIDPDFVHTERPVRGLTNAEIWRTASKSIRILSRGGKSRWRDCALDNIHYFHIYYCIECYNQYAKLSGNEQAQTMMGFIPEWDLFWQNIHTTYSIADDEFGTLTLEPY